MARNAVDILLQHLRARAAGPSEAGATDAHLLDRFIRRQDGAAFAALLERHGPMVLGVARRAVGDVHLAEDVLQATFLVLARRAGAIRRRESLAAWLHGVALRLARKARAEAARADAARADAARAGRGDTRPAPAPPPGAASDASWREVRQVLDEELARLPERYRLPLTLCYLEGRTRDEAAAALGYSPGRLKGLLERGRERLRGRLIRRGLAPAVAAAALLTEAAFAAPVPPLLVAATERFAVHLAAGAALHACGASVPVIRLVETGEFVMTLSRALLIVALVLGIGALGTGAGLWAQRSGPVDEGAPVAATGDKSQTKHESRTDRDRLQGVWLVQSSESDGKAWPPGAEMWIFEKDELTVSFGLSAVHTNFTVDATTNPRRLTLTARGAGGKDVVTPCIYKLEGDRLTICLDKEGKDFVRRLPTEFTGKAGTGMRLIVLRRAPKKQAQPVDDKLAAAAPPAPDGPDLPWPAGAWPRLEARPEPLDRAAADTKARQYLGIGPTRALRLTTLYLTDDAFPFVRPRKQAIWLAEVRDYHVPARTGEAVLPHFYVALDAETGQLIEAFTRPAQGAAAPALTGAALDRFFRDTGQSLERPKAAPKLPLLAALREVRGVAEGTQVIVRYGVYTNTGAGRTEGGKFTPAAQRRPAFLVFHDGVRVRTRAGEIAASSLQVVDAETGALLHNESFGNPPEARP